MGGRRFLNRFSGKGQTRLDLADQVIYSCRPRLLVMVEGLGPVVSTRSQLRWIEYLRSPVF